MVFDSALANAKIGGDVLTGVASEDQFHDLTLSRRQIRDVARRSLPPGCKSRSNNPSLKRPICSAAPELNCGI